MATFGVGWLALLLFAIGVPAGLAGAEAGKGPDWQELESVEVIEVLTVDADGSPRETKVWFVLVDGQPMLRTSRSRWLDNLRREPDFRVRIGPLEYDVRAEELSGGDIVEQVDAASVEKYGMQERVVHVFRFRTPDILRVGPRE
jgi:hypothetical protein